ncbi:ribosomal L28 family-domain-containing protein [Calycina marina]|uniref:Large ribosomal subunit protein bL28m n=1 Tax=Calycina marina TaxID=1763456 RepID=A0A9P8CEE2_9HELO|nr:ribosomal L28 family-domain-containing protein [Calycina marina]
MSLLSPVHPSFTHLRFFTCTARTLAKSTKKRLEHEHSAVPIYPYGPSQYYKQSNFGLYGTQKIRFGNMVSERNEIKTRRHWRPNVHSKRLYSEALGGFIKIRVTTKVLRTVDKVGGLDEYLLGEKAGRIKELGMGGWKLRWRIMQTEVVRERFRRQREAMGLKPVQAAHTSLSGDIVSKEQVEKEIMAYDQILEMGVEVEVGDDAELNAEVPTESGFMQEKQAPKEKIIL